MVPKIIHYCWFGKKKKSKLILDCIASWKKYLPDYEIIEWNESNFNLDNSFSREMYANKKWAFVSDYARLKILYENGGVYLDTDMMLIKSINTVIENDFECVLCAEDDDFISCGFIACTAKNIFIKNCLEYYQDLPVEIKPIPQIITRIFQDLFNYYESFDTVRFVNSTTILPADYFYPLPLSERKNIKQYPSYISEQTIGVHLWNYSWEEMKPNENEYYYIDKKEYIKAIKIILYNIATLKIWKIRQYLGSIKSYIYFR